MTISDDFREWAIQESHYKGKVDYESGLLATKCEGKEEDIRIGEQTGLETAAWGRKRLSLSKSLLRLLA